jgi:hypothetical protein
MGLISSRFSVLDEASVYTYNNKTSISMHEFETGDLIFFSKRFPTSVISRNWSRLCGNLWTGCGVVVYAPSVWPNEVLLLEMADTHPDDFLADKLTLKNVGSGLRLVSLASRIQTAKDFEAIGIRLKKARDVFAPSAETQFRDVNALKDVAAEVTAQTLALECLKRWELVKAPHVQLSLNQMVGAELNKWADPYNKTEIYTFPK